MKKGFENLEMDVYESSLFDKISEDDYCFLLKSIVRPYICNDGNDSLANVGCLGGVPIVPARYWVVS